MFNEFGTAFFFIYDLFNDAVSSSDCTVSNDRMNNEQTENDMEGPVVV
jgi:hypothetical protein